MVSLAGKQGANDLAKPVDRRRAFFLVRMPGVYPGSARGHNRNVAATTHALRRRVVSFSVFHPIVFKCQPVSLQRHLSTAVLV
jgi:hypothetical protein